MNNKNSKNLYSQSVRAGKRTYFFDVKATNGNDLYAVITESRRSVTSDNENPRFEKQRIFLFKEDFEDFLDGMDKTLAFIRSLQGKDGFRSAESTILKSFESDSTHQTPDIQN